MSKQKVITFIEWKTVKEEKEIHLMKEPEESQKEVMEEANEGKMLILRRALSGLKTKEEQPENIFHSQCTV